MAEPEGDVYTVELHEDEHQETVTIVTFVVRPVSHDENPEAHRVFCERFPGDNNDHKRWWAIESHLQELVVQTAFETKKVFTDPACFFNDCVKTVQTKAQGLRLCNGWWKLKRRGNMAACGSLAASA